jgi:OmpA-OmpF porin, OOP family
MLNGKWITGSLAVAALLASAATRAAPAETGFYLGVNGGQSKYDQEIEGADDIVVDALQSNGFLVLDVESDVDDSDTSFAGFFGYRFHPNVAAELAYVDLGELTYNSTVLATSFLFGGVQEMDTTLAVSSKGPVASAFGIWPVSDVLELYGRAGIFVADTEYSATASILTISETVSESHTSVDSVLGVGAALNLGNTWTFRLEYQRYVAVGDEDSTGETDIDLFQLGVMTRF